MPESPAPGIRLAVKDLFDTAGLETTYGSAIFAGHVPSETAAAVRLLEEAGYANVGKANLHEFAYGTTSENRHFGDVPNPRFPGRVAGGSSGGSAAAVAAGLADAALGTDSAGSIRIPAACCAVVGHKPTHGLVPLDGCWPLAASFDTGGPIAGNVESCARMLRALAPSFRACGARVARAARGRRCLDRARRPARPRTSRGGRRALPAPTPRRDPTRPERDLRPLQSRGRGRPSRALRRERRSLRRGRAAEAGALFHHPRRRRRACRAAAPRVPRAGRDGDRGPRSRADADAADRAALAPARSRTRRPRCPRGADPLHLSRSRRSAGRRSRCPAETPPTVCPSRSRSPGAPARTPSSSPQRGCWSQARPKASDRGGR